MEKRYLGFLFVALAFTSCTENTNSSTDDINNANNSSITETMNIDYGNHIESCTTLLFGDAVPFFNYKNYGIDKLYAGDIVKVSYSGNLIFQETYPKIAKLEGSISNVEVVTQSEKINFTTFSNPGGGYSIVCDDSTKDYVLPEYYVVDGNGFFSTSDIYNGLKFIGTIKKDKENNKLDGLYAIDFDKSKTDIKENQTKTIDEELNDYCDDFINILNEKASNDYYYSVTTNDYTIESQKVNDIEYFKYNSEINTPYTYEINKENVKIYSNGIIYNDTITNYKNTKNYELMSIISLLRREEPFKNNEVYKGYNVNFYKIDPCCGGPVYLIFTKDKIEIKLYFSYKKYELHERKYYISEKDYLPFDEYIKKAKNTANSIKLSNDYAFLQEIQTSEIKDNYNFLPGFGIFKFFDKKYDGAENNIVFYESYAFPDCSFTINQCITHIFISDKEFNFNDSTLNDSVNTIIEKYQKLGFTLKNTWNDKSNNKAIYKLFKDGINITITEVDKKAKSIDFAVLQTNIHKVAY
ncbi:MAG: hypothetical protein SOU19_08220 [Candidatus Caccosoma sp.]|nr:hypothetical protein [Candidatus Caccosoma sp.]